MRKEGIPLRKSVIIGETLAIFPGILFHGLGHHYAGDHEMGSELMDKEWKSVAYPIVWPLLGVATLSAPDNAALVATFDEATSISLISPFLFVGTWFYDLFKTPARVRDHNRMVDRMWEVKEVLDEADFPGQIRLGSVRPGETLDLPLGVRDRLPSEVEVVFRLGPLEGPGELEVHLRPSPTGDVYIRVAVPPETQAGTYRSTLRYQPADVDLTERTMPLSLRVLEPEMRLKLSRETVDLRAAGTGWVRALAEFVYESPLPGTCEVAALPLVGPEGLKIHPEFDVRLSPQEGWDGTNVESGKTYRMEVAIHVSHDLPDGVYQGTLEIRAAPVGQVATVIPYPVELTISR